MKLLDGDSKGPYLRNCNKGLGHMHLELVLIGGPLIGRG